MNCKKCGFVLEPNAAFCTNCGEPVANNNGGETPIQSVVENVNTQIPQQPTTENVNIQSPVQQVQAPIMPDAKEAPLPGTGTTPVANPVVESPVPTPVVTAENIGVNQEVQVPTQPQIQGAPTVDPTQKNKKNNNVMVIVGVIILVVSAFVLIFVLLGGKNIFNGSKSKTTSSTTSSTTTSSTTTKPLAKEEMMLNGVKLFIPFGFTIDPSSTEELGIINNTSSNTKININALPTQNFDEYSNNFEGLINVITTDKISVVSSEKKMVGERLFLIFVINVNGKEERLCYTNVRDGSVIRFELVQSDMSIDDALNVFTEIAEFAVPEVEIPVE